MKKLLALVVLGIAAAGSGLFLMQDPGRRERERATEKVEASALEVARAIPSGDEPVPTRETVGVPDLVPNARAPIPDPAEGGDGGVACNLYSVDFHGIVVDGLSGKPIAGARAVIVSAKEGLRPAELQQFEREALSDERGHFRLDLAFLGSERGLGSVLAEGYGPGSFAFDRRHYTLERAEWIELLPTAVLDVQVSDSSGMPLPWASVDLSWSGEAFMGADWFRYEQERGHWRDWADEAGRTRFMGLPSEAVLEWSVRVPTQGLATSDRIALAPDESRRLEVVLANACVAGVVRDELGVPVADLELTLGPRGERAHLGSGGERTATVTSDEQGRFEFLRVPFGAFDLGPTSDQDEFVREVLPLSVDRERVTFDLTVARGLAISGRVLGTPEELSGLAFVEAESRGARVKTEVGEDGSFRLAPLAPGEHLVHAGSLYRSTESRLLQAGASGVELRALPRRKIPVRVDGARGEFVYEVRDLAWGNSYSFPKSEPSFEWEASPGTYSFAVTTTDGWLGVVPEIVIADSDPTPEIDLRLERAARVTCVHRARDRTRDLRLFVDGEAFPLLPWGMDDSGALLPGAARTVLVRAGELRAELLEGERVAASAEVTLLAGERQRIVLEPR